MKVKEVKRKNFLINPNLLREMEKLYRKLKKKTEAAERIEIIKILLKANMLVKNIDKLVKGDIQARNLFKSYLSHKNEEIDFSYLKDKQNKEKSKENQTFCFELDNFKRLFLISAKYWSLKKERWEIVFSNLTIILKSLQIIQNDIKFMAEFYKNKKDTQYFDFQRYEYFSQEFKDIQGTLTNTLRSFLPCSTFLNRIFSPEIGGLYHISQITDMDGNDINSTLECKNQILILKGQFTIDVPGEFIFVVVPTEEGFSFAEIIDWNRTEIKIKVPLNSESGCIFIYNYEAEWNYLHCMIHAEEGEIPVTTFPCPWDPPSTPPEEFQSQFEPPECDNYPGYKPIIEYIKINGEEAGYREEWVAPEDCGWIEGGEVVPEHWDPVYVWNGEEVTITFTGKFVEDVQGDLFKGWILRIFTKDGSINISEQLSATETTYKFTPQLEQSAELTIELWATNRCLIKPRTEFLAINETPTIIRSSNNTSGTNRSSNTEKHFTLDSSRTLHWAPKELYILTVARVKKISKMIVRKKPELKILGVEITQGIQHFNLPISENMTINDTIRDSNNLVQLIKGRTTVFRIFIESGVDPEDFYHSDEFRVEGILEFGGSTWLNSDNGDKFKARNRFRIDRDNIGHTLNFKLPGWAIDSRMTFLFTIWTDEVPNQTFRDTFSLTQDFISGNKLDLVIVLYDNVHKGTEGGINDDGRTDVLIITDAILAITEFFPIPDYGVNLFFPEEKDRHKKTDRNLCRHDGEGWHRLLDDLEDLRAKYEDSMKVWLGLVPVASAYELEGCGSSGDNPAAVAQAKKTSLIAHEIGHTFGLHHSPCGDLLDLFYEPIPGGKIWDTAVNVFKEEIESIPVGSGDLMSYCHPQFAHPIIWEYLRNKLEEEFYV